MTGAGAGTGDRAGTGEPAPRTAALPGAIFRDGKDAAALRTIGEVAKALGLRQHVLRYWEDQFAMLRPITRAGGRRYYRPSDIALLIEIDRLLHRDGYTIRGARLVLARQTGRRTATTSRPVPATDRIPADAADDEQQAAAIVVALMQLRRHLGGIHARLSDALSADPGADTGRGAGTDPRAGPAIDPAR